MLHGGRGYGRCAVGRRVRCTKTTADKKLTARLRTRDKVKWQLPASKHNDPCAQITPPQPGTTCACQVEMHKLPYGGLCEPGSPDLSNYSRSQWAADLVICGNDAAFYRYRNKSKEAHHPIDITSGYLGRGVSVYNSSEDGRAGSAITNAVCAIDIEVKGEDPPGVFASHWLFDMMLRNAFDPHPDRDKIGNKAHPGVWLLYNTQDVPDVPFGCGPNFCPGCLEYPCPISNPSPSYPWPSYDTTTPFLIPYPSTDALVEHHPEYPPSLKCRFHAGLLHQLEGGRASSTIQAVFLGDVRIPPPPRRWIDAGLEYGIQLQSRIDTYPYFSRTVITNGIAIVPLQVEDFSPDEPHVLISDDLFRTLAAGQEHLHVSLVLTSQPTPSPDDEKSVWSYKRLGCATPELSLCVNNYKLHEATSP